MFPSAHTGPFMNWVTAQLVRFLVYITLAIAPVGASAHTIDASYGGIFITQDSDMFTLRFELNIEALQAGIDLSLANTNDSPNAPEYDRLRALTPDEVRAETEELRQEILAGIDVRFDGQTTQVRVIEEYFPDEPDLTKPRVTGLVIEGNIPEDAETVSFGWEPQFGPVLFRTVGARTRVKFIERIEAGERSETLALADIKARGRGEMFNDFIVVGFEHIVPKGLDHILFVVGIFLLSTRLRPILTQVTTFTVAHTVTLGLGAAGWISIPPSIVEPLIAASIVYVAVENIFTEKLSPWRPFLVFGFGLLHGLGFAGILTEFNLSADDFLFGLLAFNIGVELGQLLVIAVCFLLVGIWFGRKPWYHTRIVIPSSAVIALIAAYWFLERTIL